MLKRTGCTIVSTGSEEFFMVTAQFLQTRLAALLIEVATAPLIVVFTGTWPLQVNDTKLKGQLFYTYKSVHLSSGVLLSLKT